MRWAGEGSDLWRVRVDLVVRIEIEDAAPHRVTDAVLAGAGHDRVGVAETQHEIPALAPFPDRHGGAVSVSHLLDFDLDAIVGRLAASVGHGDEALDAVAPFVPEVVRDALLDRERVARRQDDVGLEADDPFGPCRRGGAAGERKSQDGAAPSHRAPPHPAPLHPPKLTLGGVRSSGLSSPKKSRRLNPKGPANRLPGKVSQAVLKSRTTAL